MGKQKSSESTSYSGSAQKWATPYAKQGAYSAFDVFNSSQGNLANATKQTGGIADSLYNKFGASGEQAGQARGYIGDVLSGKYMNANPYLQANIDGASRGIRDNVNSNYALGGRFGSNAHDGTLAREIGSVESGMRMQDYNNQSARMDQAAGMAMQGNSQDASQALAAYGMNAELPYTGANNLAQQLGALFSGGTQKSVSYAPNPIWGAVGAGLGAAGMAFSDRRLKKDIVELGIRPDGLTAFEWTYKHDPEAARYRGVMADEVKIKRPEAFIENFNGSGFDGVNYGALGTPMVKVA